MVLIGGVDFAITQQDSWLVEGQMIYHSCWYSLWAPGISYVFCRRLVRDGRARAAMPVLDVQLDLL